METPVGQPLGAPGSRVLALTWETIQMDTTAGQPQSQPWDMKKAVPSKTRKNARAVRLADARAGWRTRQLLLYLES